MKSKAEKFVKNLCGNTAKKKYKGRYKTMANQEGKSKYTRAQKRAYYSGMGYATAYHNKQINFATPENKESFKAGYKQGVAMAKQTPDKYPPLTVKKSRGKKAKKSADPAKVVVEIKQ